MVVRENKENFFKRYNYIVSWISLIGILGLIAVSPNIKFLLTGKPTIVITSIGCPANITNDFNTFLTSKCNELSVGKDENLSKEIISQFIKSSESSISEAKINKASAELCTTFIRCTYNVVINDVITIHDCVSYCVTRAKTNQTECHSNC